jgi:glutamine phosphoribosylpyrophosphate amidotransferase
VGADTLGYLSLEGLHASVGKVLTRHEHRGLCDACFSNRYPIPLPAPMRVRQLRLISA